VSEEREGNWKVWKKGSWGPVLFPSMGIEIGMEIIYFHSEK